VSTSQIVPRYWYPRNEPFDLSSLGFLLDPEAKYGDIFAAGATSLASLRERSLLVLVGEPGTGKSTEFERNAGPMEGRNVCYINLREYGSEQSLQAAFREHAQIERWKEQGGILELFLDSYDESQIKNIAYVLNRVLLALKPKTEESLPLRREVLFGEALDRVDEIAVQAEPGTLPELMIRVACRMGAYDPLIGKTIFEGLGIKDEDPYEYKLAPLREVDVRKLIEDRGHDPARFLSEVHRLSIGFLAAKPITLDLLLRAYGEDEVLGESAVEIYEKGVRKLCEEPSKFRKKFLDKSPDVGRRMRTAGQAAALSMVCGRPDLWLENDTECPSKDLLTIGEVALGDVSETDVVDLADTAILVPMEPGRFAWMHRTIAEFLAGTHLVESRLSVSQITNLLVDPESKKVFPQFRETAAWVAATHVEFRRWMIGNEPETILASDVALFAASDKEAIVDHLLGALDREELFTVDYDASSKYYRLSYPGLASKLRHWILSKDKTVFVRREAIEIAEACRLGELESELVDIALNTLEDPNVRISASHAVVKYASTGSKHLLRPLVDEPNDRDPYAQLRGDGLRACWPDGIALLDALSAISRPCKRQLIGSFSGFKDRDFAKGFRREFLRDSLVWLLCSDAPRRGRASRESVAGVLFAKAWDALSDPEICDLLGRIWARRAKRFEETFEYYDSFAWEVVIADWTKRRALVESVVRHAKGKDDVFFSLVIGKRSLLTSEDYDWVWEHVFVGSAAEREAWAAVAYWFRMDKERVLMAAEREPAVRKAFANFLAPPAPEAASARRQRERLERQAAREEQQRLKVEQTDIPRRVKRRFDEAFTDPAKFWALHRDLIFKADVTGSESDWVQPDVARLPGWEFLSEDQKTGWGDLCERYLDVQSAVVEGWKERTIHHPDVAGYRCLRWLIEDRPEFFADKGEEFFDRWVSAVVFMTNELWDQKSEHDQAILRLFYVRVPSKVREWLTVLLKREAKFRADSMVFGHFGAIWDEELGTLYLSFVKGRAKQSAFRHELLTKLIARGFAPAITYAKNQVRKKQGTGEERHTRQVAMVKALLEAPDASWPYVLPILRDDLLLAKEALKEFAHGNRDENLSEIIASIGITGLGELYELLLAMYPFRETNDLEDDTNDFEEDIMDEPQSVIWFRDSLPGHLAGLGTTETLLELMRLKAAHPDNLMLKMSVLTARKQLRRSKWKPSKPAEVIKLFSTSAGRLVENGDQLLQVVVEALTSIGKKMVDRGEYHSYWDEPKDKDDLERPRPKDENTLSFFLAARLDDYLVNNGIVINREVEVRRGNKTDIHVTAISRRKEDFEPLVVVIEVKGCWHIDLGTAMQTQLLGEYLAVPGRNHGIYLVGWYDCEAWIGRDRRRTACAKAARTLPTEFFQEQALKLSTVGKQLRYVELDCRYHGRSRNRTKTGERRKRE